MNPLKLILGIVIGAFLGITVGFAIAWGFGAYSQWQNPSDPSAGSVAIIVIFTAPAGLFIGSLVGAICGVRWM